MNDIMKIVQALEDSNIFLKGVTKTIKNETKEQKRGFLGMLLGALGDKLLGNKLVAHWVALFCNRSEIVYFDSFVVEYFPKEIKEFIGNKFIKANIF